MSAVRGRVEVVTEDCGAAAADVTENSLDSLQGLLREGEENLTEILVSTHLREGCFYYLHKKKIEKLKTRDQ